jgi:Flp pilus assembly protein TadD
MINNVTPRREPRRGPVKKLLRYSKLLGLLAVGAMAGCAMSESVLTSSTTSSVPSPGSAAFSSAPASAVGSTALAASGQADVGPMSRISTAVGESAVGKGVKAMFTSKSSSMADRVPTLPSVTDRSKPPKATPEFHIAMAQQMESIGNLAGAEEQYRRALELDEKHLVALINSAHLCDRQKRMAEAEGLYLKATKLHPREAAAFNDLGLCYARQHKLAQSQAALAKAVELEGDRMLYRNNLATVLVEINRPQEALSHLQAVHEESVAQYNLGYLLANKGERHLAEQHFREALRIDPKLTAAQSWLDNLQGQSATVHSRAETLTELPAAGAGPHLHSGIQKLPPVDSIHSASR